MEKMKQITLNIKRWQAGMVLAVVAMTFSYLLAVSAPANGLVAIWHLLSMIVSGVAGVVLFIHSAIEMWEKWDA